LKIYEILFLIRPDLEKEELKNLYAGIESIIEKYKGKIDSAQDLGKRMLAYSVKKHKEGIYYLVNVKMDPALLKAFKEELKLTEPVLRTAFTALDSRNPVSKPITQ
jgi:small subunit ribosomal protein S6